METNIETSYFVRRGTERLGQLSVHEIISLLKDGEAFYEIQVKTDLNQAWQPLSHSEHLARQVAMALTNAPNTSEEGYSTLSNWRIANSEKGPFNYLAMVQFLQNHRIEKDEWVCHPRLEGPMQIKNIPLFGDINVETLFEFATLKPIFERRKNVRINYENRVLLYGESHFYAGNTWSLSTQGLGVVLDANMPFQTGETLRVHLHKTNNHAAIQVAATVVSRVDDDLSTRLGLVFQHEVEPLTEYIQDVAF